MKYLKYILFPVFLFFGLSCGDDFGDLNVDPNNPAKASAESLLTSGEVTLAAQTCGTGQAYFGWLWAQYFSQNNYTDESRFKYRTEGVNFNWDWYYAVALNDFQEIQRIVDANPNLFDPASDQNKIAIAKVLSVIRYHDMTDIFGPVPYSEALKGDQIRTPKYDSQKDIYLGLLRDLKDATGRMDAGAGSFGSADVIYGGDVAKWKKFANSLRLRIAMRMADVEPDAAKAEVEAAFADAFTSNDDNAYFHYLNSQPNNNILNQSRIARGDADYGMSKTFVDNTLMPLNDPRLPVFADEKVDGGGYAGRPYGQSSGHAAGDALGNYSQPSGAAAVRGEVGFKPLDILAPDAVGRFMSYAEVCFIAAEAKERGWNLPGTAAEWYGKGITASLEEWGTTDQTAIANYLAQPAVNYATATGDWKQKIGVQKWIALFLQGTQGWCEWRRLDFQKLELPVDGALLDIGGKPSPARLPYPTNEQTQNGASYQAALGLLGGPDKLSTRLWWDVK